MLSKNPAWFSYEPAERSYYFAPEKRTSGPYTTQRKVTAILDIADDGTLAGVELIFGELPLPPKGTRHD